MWVSIAIGMPRDRRHINFFIRSIIVQLYSAVELLDVVDAAGELEKVRLLFSGG